MSESKLISDAVSSGVLRALGALEALAPCICSDNTPDDLHDFRVAARRARSQLSVFGAWLNPSAQERLLAHLKGLAARTDELRDLDVLQADLLTLADCLPEILQRGIESLSTLLQDRRDKAYAELRDYLGADEFPNLLKQCRELSAELGQGIPAVELNQVSQAAVPMQIENTQQRARKLSKKLNDSDLHKLRIAGKKLRYMLDFLESSLPSAKVRRAQKVLKSAQEELGRFHDHCVQQDFLSAQLQSLPATPENAALSQTLSGILAVLQLRKKRMAKKAYKHTDSSFSAPELEELRRALTKQAHAT